MKNRESKEWIWPPADQWFGTWGLLLIAAIAIVANQILGFFTRLSGTPWIWCYFIGVGVGALGASLIFYAKLPLYRERRFFTFGSRAQSEHRRPFYRWGYGCAVLGGILLACLLMFGH